MAAKLNHNIWAPEEHLWRYLFSVTSRQLQWAGVSESKHRRLDLGGNCCRLPGTATATICKVRRESWSTLRQFAWPIQELLLRISPGWHRFRDCQAG